MPVLRPSPPLSVTQALPRFARKDESKVPPLFFGASATEALKIDQMTGGLAQYGLSILTPASMGDSAASSGFALAMASRLISAQPFQRQRLIWIIEDRALSEYGLPYGPGLGAYGLDCPKIVLIRTLRSEQLWLAMEEALRAEVGVVLAEFAAKRGQAPHATTLRRINLACQKHHAPALVLQFGTQAQPWVGMGMQRLEIAAAPSQLLSSAFGRPYIPGQAQWQVKVLKARAGPHISRALDRDYRHFLRFDLDKKCFAHALPVAVSAVSAHRAHSTADVLPLQRRA